MNDDKLRIQIFDAEGRIVTDDLVEADTVSETEIDEMVALIDAGFSARHAAAIVKNQR